MTGNSDCECSVCREVRREGISHDEALRRLGIRDAHFVEQIGWTVHVITDEPTAHTHGLEESYGHLDVQVWLPTNHRKQYELLATVAEAVKAGRRYAAGKEYNDLFNVPVRFVEREEGGRRVLRLIVPDPNGLFPDDHGCMPGYDMQLHE